MTMIESFFVIYLFEANIDAMFVIQVNRIFAAII